MRKYLEIDEFFSFSMLCYDLNKHMNQLHFDWINLDRQVIEARLPIFIDSANSMRARALLNPENAFLNELHNNRSINPPKHHLDRVRKNLPLFQCMLIDIPSHIHQFVMNNYSLLFKQASMNIFSLEIFLHYLSIKLDDTQFHAIWDRFFLPQLNGAKRLERFKKLLMICYRHDLHNLNAFARNLGARKQSFIDMVANDFRLYSTIATVDQIAEFATNPFVNEFSSIEAHQALIIQLTRNPIGRVISDTVPLHPFDFLAHLMDKTRNLLIHWHNPKLVHKPMLSQLEIQSICNLFPPEYNYKKMTSYIEQNMQAILYATCNQTGDTRSYKFLKLMCLQLLFYAPDILYKQVCIHFNILFPTDVADADTPIYFMHMLRFLSRALNPQNFRHLWQRFTNQKIAADAQMDVLRFHLQESNLLECVFIDKLVNLLWLLPNNESRMLINEYAYHNPQTCAALLSETPPGCETYGRNTYEYLRNLAAYLRQHKFYNQRNLYEQKVLFSVPTLFLLMEANPKLKDNTFGEGEFRFSLKEGDYMLCGLTTTNLKLLKQFLNAASSTAADNLDFFPAEKRAAASELLELTRIHMTTQLKAKILNANENHECHSNVYFTNEKTKIMASCFKKDEEMEVPLGFWQGLQRHKPLLHEETISRQRKIVAARKALYAWIVEQVKHYNPAMIAETVHAGPIEANMEVDDAITQKIEACQANPEPSDSDVDEVDMVADDTGSEIDGVNMAIDDSDSEVDGASTSLLALSIFGESGNSANPSGKIDAAAGPATKGPKMS